MINKIKITNLADAESQAYGPNNDFDVWLTAVDVEDKRKVARMRQLFRNKNVEHFAQFFSDWSDEDSIQWKHLELTGPRLQHVQNFITFMKPFVEDNRVHNVGINCFAGISRSTALGIIVFVMSGLSPKEALTKLLKVRPEAWPNLRMLKFASQILNQDIFSPIEQWKKDAMGSSDLYIPPYPVSE